MDSSELCDNIRGSNKGLEKPPYLDPLQLDTYWKEVVGLGVKWQMSSLTASTIAISSWQLPTSMCSMRQVSVSI